MSPTYKGSGTHALLEDTDPGEPSTRTKENGIGLAVVAIAACRPLQYQR